MEKGLVHLYWGEGKGKTTAAMGLALRALGSGQRVTVVQFLKDGQSGELEPLQRLGARVYSGRAGAKFVFQMTPQEKAETAARQTAQLARALAGPCGLDMADKALLQKAVLERPAGREVVLTGRQPADWMRAAADYSTEMRCHRHPYERGIAARKGVEF